MLDRQSTTGFGINAATAHRRTDALITVVIPTRNRLAFLKEAVESVAGQSFSGWRLIVVDDASSDDTKSWLGTHADERIGAVHCARHVERSAARNLGLAGTVSPYVLFLDDDDRLRPRALAQLWEGLEARPQAFAAVGAMADFDGRGHRRRATHPRWPVTRPAWREVLAGWVAITGQILFRTDRLRRAGGFDPTMALAEDQELWLRMGREPAAFVPWVVLDKRAHGSSRDGPEAELVWDRIRERFVEQLEGRERATGEMILRARGEIRRSVEAFDAADFRLAARHLVRGAVLSPSLMLSPVTGIGLACSIGKAVTGAILPREAALTLRDCMKRFRTLQRRDPFMEST